MKTFYLRTAGIKILMGLTAAVLVFSCTSWQIFRDREEVYGKNPPAVAHSFASDKIRPGDTWKVYLEASDPDGDMDSIVTEIDQPGQGAYPASYTRITGENRKDLSGFVYLNTMSSGNYTWQENLNLSVTILIKDKAGHLSPPLVLPLSFNGRFSQEKPPQNLFQETNLGPILITLRHYADGNSGDMD